MRSSLARDQRLLNELSRQLRASSDQTVYLPAHTALAPDTRSGTKSLSGKTLLKPYWTEQQGERASEEFKSVGFSVEGSDPPDVPAAARADAEIRVQATKCFRGIAYSLTLRDADKLPSRPFAMPPKAAHQKRQRRTATRGVEDWMAAANRLIGWETGDYHVMGKEADEVALASFREIGDEILRLVTAGSMEPLRGLLFITGETKAGKSSIARSIICTYLKSLRVSRSGRIPHLITCEDPIEKWFYPFGVLEAGFRGGGLFSKDRRLIDYTPRERGVDCDSLKDCTRDALRQAPAVFFAGEIRTPKDLREAVDFAGTGHFIVATGHAGSLFESVEQIFTATGMSTPAKRATTAPKLLGVVHLKHMTANYRTADGVELRASIKVPSLYRRCPLGLQGLVSDGLASILPHCPATEADAEQCGSFGRQCIVQNVLLRSAAPQPRPRSDCRLAWDRAVHEPQSPQAQWKKQWGSIRLFHASPGNGDWPANEREMWPLWLRCAEGDVNGIG